MRLILTILIVFTFLYFLGCSHKKNEQLVICEKDTSRIDEPNAIIQNNQKINDTANLVRVIEIDSINKVIIKDDTSLIEKKQVTEFKKTIFSKTMDLNFDKKGDLALIYIIATEQDTISYLSIYIHQKNEMKNTFDIRFDEKIEKIQSISTYTDSTIIINAIMKNSKKKILKKFKFINEYKYIPLN